MNGSGNNHMEKNLNLLIDLMEFLSFWMVAPEFLGESRMRNLENRVMKLEVYMPGLVFGLSGVLTGIFFSEVGSRLNEVSWWKYLVFTFLGIYFTVITVFQIRIRNYLSGKVFGPFFKELSDSGVFRQKLLKAGVFLFTLSFLLKLVVYFLV
jgi:hypothetical protein